MSNGDRLPWHRPTAAGRLRAGSAPALSTVGRLAAVTLLAAATAGGVTVIQNAGQPAVEAGAAGEVYFSPRGGCTEAVVREVAAARRSVRVQAYSFTSRPIADALLAAHRRGVRVEAVFDKSDVTGNGSLAGELAAAGVPCRIDAAHAIAHNKVMVIDDAVVITGSFNFTAAAEGSNAENLLVVRDRALAKKYADNWQRHQEHSKPWGEK